MIYSQHELGKCFPPLSADELEKLEETIRKDGPSPVILFEGKILDGWHQYQTCLKLDVAPFIQSVHPDDPVSYVIRRNNGRRHLTVTARAKIVDNLANLKLGSNQHVEQVGSPIGEASSNLALLARELNVGATTVSKLRLVNKRCIPSVKDAVDKEEIPIDAGYEIGRLPADEQPEALSKAKKGQRVASLRMRKGPKKVGPTQQEMRARRDALLSQKKGGLGLSPEEVDPDFKGTHQAFVDKHGLVNIFTAKEIEKDKDESRFSEWVAAFRALRMPLSKYLEIGKFRVENYHAFIARAGNKERREGEIKELVSLVVRAHESIEWLLEELEKK
jgi:hypothetical protein